MAQEYINLGLQKINERGETIRDPMPLDEKLQLIENYTKSSNFPFSRD